LAFLPTHGRGDELQHGGLGLNPRDQTANGLKTRDIDVPDLHLDAIKVKARDFR